MVRPTEKPPAPPDDPPAPVSEKPRPVRGATYDELMELRVEVANLSSQLRDHKRRTTRGRRRDVVVALLSFVVGAVLAAVGGF